MANNLENVDRDMDREVASIHGYEENFKDEDLYDREIREREIQKINYHEEELTAQTQAGNLGVHRQEEYVKGQVEEQGYLNSQNLSKEKKEQAVTNSCKTYCEICHNLRSPDGSNIATRSTPISTQDYVRTYRAFKDSSLKGCATCKFIVDSLLYFGQLHEDSMTVVLRIEENGGSGLYIPETSLALQIYTPIGAFPAWPRIVHSPELSLSPTSQQAFKFIESCLSRCETQHTICRLPSPQLPTRLIKVSQTCLSSVRLVETASLPNEPYIALSYCWGKGDNVNTTIASYDDMQKAIIVTSLPQTLQDAITITRKLGQKYIWIDALCIIQDSPSDWEREAAMMAPVYRNAYLSIAAETAAAASEGFLARQHLAAEYPSPFQVRWQTTEGLESLLAARVVPDLEMHFNRDEDDLPLELRGWCLQERILSTRTLTYTAHELHWICRSSSACECHTRDRYSNLDRENRIPFASILETTEAEAWDKWKHIVNEYTGRSLTNISDTLPAIAGIANVIQGLTGSEYVAGLWRDDLVMGLAWSSANPGNDKLGELPCALKDYIAPTFSWASIHGLSGPVEYGDGSRHSRHPMQWSPGCKVIDSGSIVRGQNPLGQVESGFVRLKGWMTESVLRPKKAWEDENLPGLLWFVVVKDDMLPLHPDTRLEEFLWTNDNGVSEKSVRRSPFGSNGNVIEAEAPVFVLYLGQWVGVWGRKELFRRLFLVLGRSTGGKGIFERVGFCVGGAYGKLRDRVEEYDQFEEMDFTLV